MTQEDKELLLKDICARLPYGVHVEISWEYSKTDVYTSSEYYEFPNIDSLLNMFWDEKCISIKPYLRPLSSMTEDERFEYLKFIIEETDDDARFLNKMVFYNKYHFDYRGLIEKGLALEAPKNMYND